jgi:hypothetical protein
MENRSSNRSDFANHYNIYQQLISNGYSENQEINTKDLACRFKYTKP